MEEGVETSSSHLIFQAQRSDGVWYEVSSSLWVTEQSVREEYDRRRSFYLDGRTRLIRRDTTVTVTETVVES